MPAAPKLPVPNNLPGTDQSILAGCSCAMAPLPVSLLSADVTVSTGTPANAVSVWEALQVWKNNSPPGAWGLTTVATGQPESLSPSEERFLFTQGPYFPSTNSDTVSYWGDFTITALTHTLGSNTINFTIGTYNNPNIFRLETNDFIYIRGVTPTAYNRRYLVYRTGANTYTAYHDSATALAAGSVLGGFTVPSRTSGEVGADQYIVPVAGAVMVGSVLDCSFKTIPIKSAEQDRIYLLNEFMTAKLLDNYTTSAARLSPLKANIASNRAVIPRDFNPLTLMETRVDVNCPMHGYQALT